MFLSDGQLKSLDDNGYLIVKNVLDPTKTVDRVFSGRYKYYRFF